MALRTVIRKGAKHTKKGILIEPLKQYAGR